MSESETDRDWPGDDTWLCDDCNEPKLTEDCWPCETADGRLTLCSECRDNRDVDPVTLTDGGQSQSENDTEQEGSR